jgi:ribokinase
MTVRSPRIGLIGLAAWDRLIAIDHYPESGGHAMVDREVEGPGGTTANTAAALARLGAAAMLVSAVGDDAEGRELARGLAAAGVDVSWLAVRPGERTDRATILVAGDPPERTIFWHAGAQPKRGDRIPVELLFAHDVVVLDLPDIAMVRFLLDLPVHTIPRTRLIGTLTYLADPDLPDAFDLALRHDVVVGNERQALAVTGTWSLADATTAWQRHMRGHNLRAAIITRGAAGCRVVTENDRWQLPPYSVPAVDPTGAGDAFAAGVAYGVARRWNWPRVGRFANGVGALAIRALGAQAALPTLPEVESLIGDDPPVTGLATDEG